MKLSEALQQHRQAILEIVARHHAANPRVFGSVLHGEDHEGSDLDLLIVPTPQTTLFDIARIQKSLQGRLGIKIDILRPRALPESFRDEVINEARPL